MNSVRGWLRAIFLLALSLVVVACDSGPRVIISTKSGKELVLRVEVVETPAKRALGLQYRNELADDQGMLFLFRLEAVQSFWMKNTPLSLDMIFIGSDLKIVGIIHQAVPFSTASLSVSAPSQFVLETRGGLSRLSGIEAGDRVRFEGISLDGVRE
ncbi:MAG: DUF192 domain-containing protein [Deltaproteobacteria bacterium]|nr:DUF192 domain-containing protein [Deltaproteobacteria bacterium]